MARLLSVLAMVALGLWAAGEPDAHYINLRGQLVEDGKLTFGVALTGRPFAYRQDGELRGFEVELAAAVARSRGLELEVVQVARADLAAALEAGEVDLVNSLALDPQASKGLAVQPYLLVGDHMMVLKGNPFRIRAVEDLAGRTVSTTMGSSAEAFAHELSQRLVEDGLQPMNIHAFPNQRDTHFPVSMGHAAAYFIQTVSALVPALDPDSRVKVVEGVFRPRREVGFGLMPADEDLKDAVEHAIAAQLASSTYDRLRAEHGIPDDLSPFR
jgi:ABC-type amino acid transport substrate-binding protein